MNYKEMIIIEKNYSPYRISVGGNPHWALDGKSTIMFFLEYSAAIFRAYI